MQIYHNATKQERVIYYSLCILCIPLKQMQKTLVIILSETRAHELTFSNFKKNVIDELNADLCLCIGVKSDYDYENPFYKLAKYRFLYDEENDKDFAKSVKYSYNETLYKPEYEVLEHTTVLHENALQPNMNNHISDENVKYLGEVDSKYDIKFHRYPNNDAFVYHMPDNQHGYYSKKLYSVKTCDGQCATNAENVVTYIKPKHYTEFLKIKNRIQTETEDPTKFTNFSISTYIHTFFLWFLQKKINEYDLLSKYDRFLILRSDYMYILPFPRMNVLNDEYIWIPDWEDYNGICDRSVVLSSIHFNDYVGILSSFYKRSNKYYNNISNEIEWNMERILKMHLCESGVFHLVRRYPYISYAVRNINGTTRWSEGVYSEEHSFYIKYNAEYERALYYKREYEYYSNKKGINDNDNNNENSYAHIDEFYRGMLNRI